MIKVDADIILASNPPMSNLQFPVNHKHVYRYQDGKNKKKQEKRVKELEEENDEFDCEMEAESSGSEAEEEMIKKFQLGEHKEAKWRKRETNGSQESRGEDKADPGEEGGRKKRLADEAVMNIVCDDIPTNATKAVLGGGGPPSGPTMELSYEGSRAMLRIKQAWIISRYKEVLYRARRIGLIGTNCNGR